jgi:hypothetical protein
MPQGILMALIALLAWFGLILQFSVTFPQSLALGRTPLASIAFYFSFFTILTNLLIAVSLTLTIRAPASRPGSFFSNPIVQTATALYIAVVGIVYSLVLRSLWDPEGLQKIADLLLHDAVPLLYVLFWTTSVPKHTLRWQHAAWWLTYPFAYLLWALFRGSSTGIYPYPFLDLRALGSGRVLINVLILMCVFFTHGLALIALGRWRARHTNSS